MELNGYIYEETAQSFEPRLSGGNSRRGIAKLKVDPHSKKRKLNGHTLEGNVQFLQPRLSGDNLRRGIAKLKKLNGYILHGKRIDSRTQADGGKNQEGH